MQIINSGRTSTTVSTGFISISRPLSERQEDISPLVDAFISELSAVHGKHVTGITPEALQYLEGAAWPGNIRQLKNAIERAIITTQTPELEVADLPAEIALVPQPIRVDSRNQNTTRTVPPEVSEILARLSVIEFISIFGGIPIAVWQHLPTKTRNMVVRETAFYLSELSRGHIKGRFISGGKDRQQILTEVAQRRVKEHGSLTQAAASLGIDRRTLKTYTEGNGAERG